MSVDHDVNVPNLMQRVLPRVFFSYASEDANWVEAFKKYFSTPFGRAEIKDYLADDDYSYGPLKEQLETQIVESDAVIAFVSKWYRGKKWTVREWRTALASTSSKLVFVPIILDNEAIEWWRQLRANDDLQNLPEDYQYVDFADAGGNYLQLSRDDTVGSQRVAKLALKLKEDLKSRKSRPTPTGDLGGSKPPVATAAAASVVILDHPTARLTDSVSMEADALEWQLKSLGASVVRWSGNWKMEVASRASLDGLRNPIFVQVVSEGDASDMAESPQRTNKNLKYAGQVEPNVVVWLPNLFRNEDFDITIKNASVADQYPVFSNESPEKLARWLVSRFPSASSTEFIVVQVEGCGAPDEIDPTSIIGARDIVDYLSDEMIEIVSHAVVHPPPYRPAWQFWDTQFTKQIKKLSSSRAIVAIHDLDIPPSPDDALVRKKVQGKFERIQHQIDVEQEARVRDGKPPLKLFWTVLMVNNAAALPFGSFPDDGRYKDWRILEFVPCDGNYLSTKVQPEPASLAVFRVSLAAWANKDNL